jgi:hypothetical protein
MYSRRLVVLLTSIAVVALGCGDKNPNAPASVSGSVKYKGEVLKAGTIQFHSDQGVYTAPINSDGTYVNRDVAVGESVVTVDTESVNPNKKKEAYGGDRAKGMQEQKPPAGSSTGSEFYVKIPKKYSDPKESPLRANVKRGKQEQNFELTD